MIGKLMSGIVERLDGHYYVIDCPDAPPHLRTLHLVGWQMRGAIVGDHVELEYERTGSGYAWNVKRVVA